jgi:hypothetical protein
MADTAESDFSEGENGGTVAIYDMNGKGGGFGDQRHARVVFYRGGCMTRETKWKLKEQWYQERRSNGQCR